MWRLDCNAAELLRASSVLSTKIKIFFKLTENLEGKKGKYKQKQTLGKYFPLQHRSAQRIIKW